MPQPSTGRFGAAFSVKWLVTTVRLHVEALIQENEVALGKLVSGYGQCPTGPQP